MELSFVSVIKSVGLTVVPVIIFWVISGGERLVSVCVVDLVVSAELLGPNYAAAASNSS